MRPDIRQEALGRWPSILTALGVDERFLRNKHGACPLCGGVDRYRFDDKGKGQYFCSGCGAGDGFTMIEKLHNCDFIEAAKKVREVLPSTTIAPQKQEVDRERGRDRMNRIWKAANPLEPGDEVMRYLNGRGIYLGDFPKDLRCASSIPYFDGGRRVGEFSAMVAMVRDYEGKPKSLHVTYLKDGKKADVASPKKVLGPIGKGAAIRLAPAGERLCVAEGIETALAIISATGWPTWACISANGMRDFFLPPDIMQVRIAADNDENFVGQAAAYELARRLHRKVSVEVCVPRGVGKDWADELSNGNTEKGPKRG